MSRWTSFQQNAGKKVAAVFLAAESLIGGGKAIAPTESNNVEVVHVSKQAGQAQQPAPSTPGAVAHKSGENTGKVSQALPQAGHSREGRPPQQPPTATPAAARDASPTRVSPTAQTVRVEASPGQKPKPKPITPPRAPDLLPRNVGLLDDAQKLENTRRPPGAEVGRSLWNGEVPVNRRDQREQQRLKVYSPPDRGNGRPQSGPRRVKNTGQSKSRTGGSREALRAYRRRTRSRKSLHTKIQGNSPIHSNQRGAETRPAAVRPQQANANSQQRHGLEGSQQHGRPRQASAQLDKGTGTKPQLDDGRQSTKGQQEAKRGGMSK